jgi:hypothetical protein
MEAAAARLQRRRPQPLFHAGLEVWADGERWVIEQTPVPPGPPARRGVVGQGPVGARCLGRLRVFRYEVRRWRGGEIPDLAWAAERRRVSTDPAAAARLLGLAPQVPLGVWGRRMPGTDEMWNSNAIVAWLLARTGLPAAGLHPPGGGRAPGWRAGLVVAERG